jgi:hypothetical protein
MSSDDSDWGDDTAIWGLVDSLLHVGSSTGSITRKGYGYG